MIWSDRAVCFRAGFPALSQLSPRLIVIGRPSLGALFRGMEPRAAIDAGEGAEGLLVVVYPGLHILALLEDRAILRLGLVEVEVVGDEKLCPGGGGHVDIADDQLVRVVVVEDVAVLAARHDQAEQVARTLDRLLHGAEIVVSLLMELRLRDAQVVEDGDPLVVARDLEELFPVDPVFRQLVRRLQQHDLRGVAPPAIIGIEGGQHAELGQFPVDIAMLGENGCLDLPGLPVVPAVVGRPLFFPLGGDEDLQWLAQPFLPIGDTVDRGGLDGRQESGVVWLVADREAEAVTRLRVELACRDAIRAMAEIGGRDDEPVVALHAQPRVGDHVVALQGIRDTDAPAKAKDRGAVGDGSLDHQDVARPLYLRDEIGNTSREEEGDEKDWEAFFHDSKDIRC